jgi:hypothetical protein
MSLEAATNTKKPTTPYKPDKMYRTVDILYGVGIVVNIRYALTGQTKKPRKLIKKIPISFSRKTATSIKSSPIKKMTIGAHQVT